MVGKFREGSGESWDDRERLVQGEETEWLVVAEKRKWEQQGEKKEEGEKEEEDGGLRRRGNVM